MWNELRVHLKLGEKYDEGSDDVKSTVFIVMYVFNIDIAEIKQI